MKCPICGNNIKNDYYYGPLGIEEEYESCPVCLYSYEFAYGNHLEIIGNKVFIWSYTDYKKSNFRQKMKKLAKTEYNAKRNWKKHKKKTNVKKLPF